jgi:hypothetical protein
MSGKGKLEKHNRDPTRRLTQFPSSTHTPLSRPTRFKSRPTGSKSRPTGSKSRPTGLVNDNLAENNVNTQLIPSFTSPWDQYTQGGKPKLGLILAFRKKFPQTTVFIHEVRVPNGHLSRLKSVRHKNIVCLLQVFWEKNIASLVYEITPVSLGQILTFRPCWNLNDTATVCKEILSGLEFLHDTLHIGHGSLTAENVRLTWDGSVKIGKLPQPDLLRITADE